MFSQQEQTYLQTRRLARLATVEPDGQPDVDAVVFEFDGAHFIIRAYRAPKSRKYKNVAAGNRKVSLIIDDVDPTPPGVGRGIKIYGEAELSSYYDEWAGESLPCLIITPIVSWSWGIEAPTFQQDKFIAKKTVWK